MNSSWRVWVIAILSGCVLIALVYFPFLRKRVKQQALTPAQSEEQARRELTQPVSSNAKEPRVKAKLFWAADSADGALAPVVVELPLSDDPVLRAKQVLNTLLAGPVDTDLRTLPPDAALLAFYLLPDGTGIADFSESLATSTPSGVQSEQLAVDSILRTLEANVPQVRRLKILIHGQELDTLAGHVDLMEPFLVNANAVPLPAAPAPTPAATAAPPAPSPTNQTPAAQPSIVQRPAATQPAPAAKKP